MAERAGRRDSRDRRSSRKEVSSIEDVLDGGKLSSDETKEIVTAIFKAIMDGKGSKTLILEYQDDEGGAFIEFRVVKDTSLRASIPEISVDTDSFNGTSSSKSLWDSVKRYMTSKQLNPEIDFAEHMMIVENLIEELFDYDGSYIDDFMHGVDIRGIIAYADDDGNIFYEASQSISQLVKNDGRF